MNGRTSKPDGLSHSSRRHDTPNLSASPDTSSADTSSADTSSPTSPGALNRRDALAGLTTMLSIGALAPSLGVGQESAKRPRAPRDGRLGPLRDLNAYFPFDPPESAEQWERRARELRENILVACGLWPMPPRPRIEATVHGAVERDGYTVERVFFESSPGLYVTGSLFRPAGEGPFPTILCPHGHWANGRFYDAGEKKVADEIKAGAERFPIGGRFPLQARCVQLARMGCMVFHYDMIGYADSAPLTYEVAHRFAKQRPDLNEPQRFGMFSAQSELRLINVMGLQTWNSIRAVDWLTQREDVDDRRIGVTGASGGGTQTFLLAAVDDRPAAAFPAVMVSTAMQGGCTCENASYFRTRTGNIEIAALCAPRPLGMTAADDWTVELETKGLPELKQLYAMLGVPERLTGKYYPFPHNYNAVSRAMMYDFFNRHFELGWDEIEERDFEPLFRDKLTVWTDDHPKPACDTEAEVELLQKWSQTSDRQLAELRPTDKASADRYDRVIKTALRAMIGRSQPRGSFMFTPEPAADPDISRQVGWLTCEGEDFEIPVATLSPSGDGERLDVTIWIEGGGKQCLATDGETAPFAKELLSRGQQILSCDVLYTGWYLGVDQQPVTQTRRVANTREFAGYTLGYNDPLFAQRVQDIMALVGYAQSLRPRAIHLVGVAGAGPWVACAAALCDSVASVSLDTQGFRFGTVSDIRSPHFLPGAVKYGDLPGILSVAAPKRLRLGGEQSVPAAVAASYAARNATQQVQRVAGDTDTLRMAFAKSLS